MRDLIIEEMEPSHKTPKLKDWYVKPIEMITNNWAFIFEDGGVEVIFVRDDGVIFDTLQFENKEVAVKGLIENGFIKYSSDKEAKKYIVPPNKIVDLQNRNDIYSSGKFWIGKIPERKVGLLKLIKTFFKK
tara:strand:+ start:394 stop:786 length:393 start_codon:yes stop_codon:yes gene_type:complete